MLLWFEYAYLQNTAWNIEINKAINRNDKTCNCRNKWEKRNTENCWKQCARDNTCTCTCTKAQRVKTPDFIDYLMSSDNCTTLRKLHILPGRCIDVSDTNLINTNIFLKTLTKHSVQRTWLRPPWNNISILHLNKNNFCTCSIYII
jgi:hypothetical protein